MKQLCVIVRRLQNSQLRVINRILKNVLPIINNLAVLVIFFLPIKKSERKVGDSAHSTAKDNFRQRERNTMERHGTKSAGK